MALLGHKRRFNPNGSTTMELPIFDAGDVEYPVFKTTLPDGRVGCYSVFPEGTPDVAFPSHKFYHPTHGTMVYHNEASISKIVDNFESYPQATTDGVGPWGNDGQADTSLTEVSSSYAIVGSQGIKIHQGAILSSPGDGLNYYPQHGDIITFYFRPIQNNSYGNAWFCYENFDNHYRVQIAQGSNWFRVDRKENGTNNYVISEFLESSGQSYTLGRNYRARLYLDDPSGNIRASLEEYVNGGWYTMVDTTSSASTGYTEPAPLNTGNQAVRLTVDNTHEFVFDHITAETNVSGEGGDSGGGGSGSSTVVIEDWENGGNEPVGWDTSELTLYSVGSSYSYGAGYGAAIEGLYAESHPGDGANHYPSWGETFRFHFNPQTSDRLIVYPLFQDGGSYYFIRLNPGSSTYQLYRNGPNAAGYCFQGSVTLNQGSWYECELDMGVNGSEIEMRLTDTDSNVTTTDSYTESTVAVAQGEQGVRFGTYSGVYYVDNFEAFNV